MQCTVLYCSVLYCVLRCVTVAIVISRVTPAAVQALGGVFGVDHRAVGAMGHVWQKLNKTKLTRGEYNSDLNVAFSRGSSIRKYFYNGSY